MKKYFTSKKEECEMKENDGEEGKWKIFGRK